VIEETLTREEARRFYDDYGRKLEWSDPFEGKAKARAAELLALGPGERVLELGVGTGRFQAHACERAGPEGLVVGLDLSATMLGLSREAAAGARLVRADASRLPFPPATFDAVFSAYTLDLLPRPLIEATLAEVRRVLRPDGRAVLCSLTEGRSAVQRGLMALWKGIHQRLGAARVGGCRPLELAPFVAAAGLEVPAREHVAQLGIPSEVVVARATGGSPGFAPGP